jgi:predicted nucleic acid-binding protein
MMAYLLDSYAWLEYFGGNVRYSCFIEDGQSYTASVSLTEIVRALIRRRLSRSQIEKHLTFISKKSTVLSIGESEAIRAGFIAEEVGLHFSDALIYCLANKERLLVTGDKHFKGKDFVEFVQ